MPLLIDTETRADALVRSINHVLIDHGPAGLTLRRIARYSGVSTSSMLHHLGSREHLLRVAAAPDRTRAVAVAGRGECDGRSPGVPPASRRGACWTHARGWPGSSCGGWRTPSSARSREARADERALLARLADFQLARHDLDELFALIDGLRVAVCAPARPMRLEVAAEILAARCHTLPGARVLLIDTPSRRTAMSTIEKHTPPAARTPAARVPLEHPGSLLASVMNAYSRRQFGKVAEPMLALLHQRKVLTAVARFEMRIAKWSALDTGLKDLATLVGRRPDRVQLVHGLRLLRLAHQRDADREAGAGGDAGATARCSRRWSARCWSTPRR